MIDMTAALIPMPAPVTGGLEEREKVSVDQFAVASGDEGGLLTDDADDEPRLRGDEQLADVGYQP
jgi:hypothetical protein